MQHIPRIRVFLRLAIVIAIGAPAVAFGRLDSGPTVDAIVILRPGASIGDIEARYSATGVDQIPGSPVYRVRVGSDGTLNRLRDDGDVRDAVRNGAVRRHQTSGFPRNSPRPLSPDEAANALDLYKRQAVQGELADAGVGAASDLVATRSDVVVAVLDTGVDATHPVLTDRIWQNDGEAGSLASDGIDNDGNGFVDDIHGWDFVDHDANPDERGTSGEAAGHGTFIAGLVALAAPGVRIMPLRVLGPDGVGTVFDAAQAIEYATRNGADVICMSFGTDQASPLVLRHAIATARASGVILVAAAGNDASTVLPYPASDTENVIAVGAAHGTRPARFSNFGSGIDVWAPGVNLISSMPATATSGPSFARWSGSSFAGALTAAGCATLVAARPDVSSDDVKQWIVGSGPTVIDGAEYRRRLDVFAALSSELSAAGDSCGTWSARVVPETGPTGPSGRATLTWVGGARRLAVTARGLTPGADYEVTASSCNQTVSATGRADELGTLELYCEPAPSSIDEMHITQVGAAEVAHARFAATEPGTMLSGSYPLANVTENGAPVPARFGFLVSARGTNQSCWITAPLAEPGATYILKAGGQTVRRMRLHNSGNLWGLVRFRSEGRLGKGRYPLPDALIPVTQARRIELYRVDRGGNERLEFWGDVNNDQ
jgi:hypothetical protein